MDTLRSSDTLYTMLGEDQDDFITLALETSRV